MDAPKNNSVHAPADFRTTHWSVVLSAAHTEAPDRTAALATLCQNYWYPLYAYIRRHGRAPDEAEDLTQAFFARLLAKEGLASVRPEHGRFRSFLLASLKNFLANDWDRARAVKRGGRYTIVSWDAQSAENRYLLEPRHEATPERLFEQSWALTILQSVLDQLRTEYANAGKGEIFEAIHSYLENEKTDTYAEIATRLSMTEGAVKMAVLRLREKFRNRLRSAIAQTLVDASDIDDELRHFFACLSG